MNQEQWVKIGKGALIAAGGAVLAYAAEFAVPTLQESGNAWLLAIAASASVLINVARKWLEAQAAE